MEIVLKKIVLQSNCNAFTHSTQFTDNPTLRTRKRRLHGSQQKGARQLYPPQGLANDAWFERTDVGGNVRQFWHGNQLACSVYAFATLQRRSWTREQHQIPGGLIVRE